MRDSIVIKGARVHNLKNVDVEIRRNTLTVITGISGSGKSSLAFDTIYAEGQRRYVESLSSYARMFLGQMEKPDVDSIDGLSPAISIDQKTTSKNPRSTVGTVTEIYDYLRLLWARIGIPHCPKCGKEIRQQSVDQIIDQLLALPQGSKMQILAPVIRGRKGEYQKVFEDARKSGYSRVRVDGGIYDLSEDIKLDKNKKHSIEIVVDRLVVKPEIARRLTDSVETAARLSGGLVVADRMGEGELTFSQNYACPDCGISLEELTPRMFSFNNPYGACPTCGGLGMKLEIDPDRIIPNGQLSLNQGAIQAPGFTTLDEKSISRTYMRAMSEKYGFSLDTPWKDLPRDAREKILYGTGTDALDVRFSWEGNQKKPRPFEGIVNNLMRRYTEGYSTQNAKEEIEECMSAVPCADCGGRRLKKEMLAVTVGGISIAQFTEKSVTDALHFVEGLELSEKEHQIADLILKEIRTRLTFLKNVGLEYLTLARSSSSLSGGESQRIRLATQIGSALMGVLYVLDEPSIGLHQRDNDKLLATLKGLRDLGNTLIVVEHDEDTMLAADDIIDVGTGAGVNGGRIIATGPAREIMKNPDSLTGQYLSGAKRIPLPAVRRPGNGHSITIRGAAENNLRHIDASIPLGTLTVVTGVSGSGKSSLINEILYKSLAAQLNGARTRAGKHDGIDGLDQLDKVIAIDQSPIGRTPRSNPATYTGLFGDIRQLFSTTQDAKARGYGPGRFSFNVRGGRCEACGGDGLLKIEMHFLPDIYVPCDVCKGKRYNRETLEVRYKGKNIYEVLDMTVAEALTFFDALPRLKKKLQTLSDVGLSYVKLGQSSTTLSGGEAQRVKLATELARRATGRTIYILDEPTTGLHSADVDKLIQVLQKLVEAGNTVVVIEHNLDVIKTADHILDLGPEGGDKGGTIVAQGTPEEVAEAPGSYTGVYLKRILERDRAREAAAAGTEE